MPQKYRNTRDAKTLNYHDVKQDELDTTEDESHSYDEESLERMYWEDRRPYYFHRSRHDHESWACCRGFCLGVVLMGLVMTFVLYGAMLYGIANVTVDLDQVQNLVNSTVQSINKALPNKNEEFFEAKNYNDTKDEATEVQGADINVESSVDAEVDEDANSASEINKDSSADADADAKSNADVQDEEGSDPAAEASADAQSNDGLEDAGSLEDNEDANAESKEELNVNPHGEEDSDAKGNKEPNADV